MPSALMLAIGTNLLRLRREADLSQARLAAAAAPVHVNTIKALETFQAKTVEVKTLESLARALSAVLGRRVDVAHLLEPPPEDRQAVLSSLEAFAASGLAKVSDAEMKVLRETRWPWGTPSVTGWYHYLLALRASEGEKR